MNISAKDDRESYKHFIWGIDIFRQMSSRHVVVMVDSNPSLNKSRTEQKPRDVIMVGCDGLLGCCVVSGWPNPVLLLFLKILCVYLDARLWVLKRFELEDW